MPWWRRPVPLPAWQACTARSTPSPTCIWCTKSIWAEPLPGTSRRTRMGSITTMRCAATAGRSWRLRTTVLNGPCTGSPTGSHFRWMRTTSPCTGGAAHAQQARRHVGAGNPGARAAGGLAAPGDASERAAARHEHARPWGDEDQPDALPSRPAEGTSISGRARGRGHAHGRAPGHGRARGVCRGHDGARVRGAGRSPRAPLRR